MLEMARPVTILQHNQTLQGAYAKALKVMRATGQKNAPTFAIWDYIWRCLPDSIKTQDLVDQKRKTSSPTLKFFIIDILKKLPPEIERQLINDLGDDARVKQYVLRPLNDRGSRAIGKARAVGTDYSPKSIPLR